MESDLIFMEVTNRNQILELLSISNSLFGENYHNFNYFKSSNKDCVIAAYFNNEIIGFLKMITLENNSTKIDCIAIKKKFQRKGVGSNMLSFYFKKHHKTKNKIIAHAWKSPLGIHAQKLNEKFGMKLKSELGKIWQDECGHTFICPFKKNSCQCEAILFST